MIVRAHDLVGANDDHRQAAFAHSHRDLVCVGLGLLVRGQARHLADECLVTRLDAGASGRECGGDVDRTRLAELEREAQRVLGAVDVGDLHTPAQCCVGTEFVDAGVVDHEVRTRHGRAHRFALRDVARNQRGTERREMQCRRALGAPHQRIELPTAVSNDPRKRLADKTRAAGEKDAHTAPFARTVPPPPVLLSSRSS